ncbi:MAG: hypothetical protein Q7T03_00970 [Deltaproteobacteria bacterium]|nr:hypothetical protein [Deltaproteobacteria bacterium]
MVNQNCRLGGIYRHVAQARRCAEALTGSDQNIKLILKVEKGPPSQLESLYQVDIYQVSEVSFIVSLLRGIVDGFRDAPCFNPANSTSLFKAKDAPY